MKYVKVLMLSALSFTAFNASAQTCKDLSDILVSNDTVALDQALTVAGEEGATLLLELHPGEEGFKKLSVMLTKTEAFGMSIFGECIKTPESDLSKAVYRSILNISD